MSGYRRLAADDVPTIEHERAHDKVRPVAVDALRSVVRAPSWYDDLADLMDRDVRSNVRRVRTELCGCSPTRSQSDQPFQELRVANMWLERLKDSRLVTKVTDLLLELLRTVADCDVGLVGGGSACDVHFVSCVPTLALQSHAVAIGIGAHVGRRQGSRSWRQSPPFRRRSPDPRRQGRTRAPDRATEVQEGSCAREEGRGAHCGESGAEPHRRLGLRCAGRVPRTAGQVDAAERKRRLSGYCYQT